MRSTRKVRLLVALAIIAVGTAAGAWWTSQARALNVKSRVSIQSVGGAFAGGVSAEQNCHSGRTVIVRRYRPGPRNDRDVGSAVTDEAGNWGPVSNTLGSGRYYARVRAKDLAGYSGIKCKGDRSPKLRI